MTPRKRLPRLPPNIAELQRGIRIIGRPEPGYFKLRLVRRGPWVPALIWRPCPLVLPEDPFDLTPAPEDWCCHTERPRPLRARIGGQEVHPSEVWERGTRITPAEYHWHVALSLWALGVGETMPRYPEAQPHKPADLLRTPSLF